MKTLTSTSADPAPTLSVSSGAGNVIGEVEVHLAMHDPATDKYVMGWFVLSEIQAALARNTPGDS